MSVLVHQIVRRLLRGGELSRNRHFDAYEDPVVQRAARVFRHLRSVEQALSAVGDGSVTLERASRDEARALTLHLVVDDGRVRRTSVLSAHEWELLLELPEVRARLSPLLDEIPEPDRLELERARGELGGPDEG